MQGPSKPAAGERKKKLTVSSVRFSTLTSSTKNTLNWASVREEPEQSHPALLAD